MKPIKPQYAGFTLIESMVVIALVAILLAVAVPSFRTFMLRYRLTTASNDFLSGITLTRNEAIKRGRRVDMVPIGGDWSNGWTIFVDQNGDQVENGSEVRISSHAAIDSTITLFNAATINATTCTTDAVTPFYDSLAGTTYIAFSGTGYRQRNSGVFTTEQGIVFQFDNNNQRCVIITPIGRPRTIGK